MRSILVAVCLLGVSPHFIRADDSKQSLPAPSAGPIISIPKAITGAVGQLIEVKAETGAELVTWKATEGLRLVNDDPPDPARKTILVHASTAGTFALCASIPAEKGTRAAIALVTIGEPPKPEPTPDPSAFEKSIKAAFAAETDPQKATKAALLAAVYRGAIAKTVDETATVQRLQEVMRSAVEQTAVDGGFMSVRKAIAEYLKSKLPTTANLDAELRAKVKAEFAIVAAALEGLR